jgi:hypothetical protein
LKLTTYEPKTLKHLQLKTYLFLICFFSEEKSSAEGRV